MALFGGVQIAIDTTDGSARPGAAQNDGVALRVARRREDEGDQRHAGWCERVSGRRCLDFFFSCTDDVSSAVSLPLSLKKKVSAFDLISRRAMLESLAAIP